MCSSDQPTELTSEQRHLLFDRLRYLEVSAYAQAHRDFDGTLRLLEQMLDQIQREPVVRMAIPGVPGAAAVPLYGNRSAKPPLKPRQVPVPQAAPAPAPEPEPEPDFSEEDDDERGYAPARIRQRPERREQRRFDGDDYLDHDAPYRL